jgi:hypothetical protein
MFIIASQNFKITYQCPADEYTIVDLYNDLHHTGVNIQILPPVNDNESSSRLDITLHDNSTMIVQFVDISVPVQFPKHVTEGILCTLNNLIAWIHDVINSKKGG